MRKILFTLLALSLLAGASAQTKKCGIDTKALVAEQIASGATHIDMLAQMVPGFNRAILEKSGIVIGAQAGQIITLSVPIEALPLLDSNKEVMLYSISHPIAQPECNDTRFDTRTDSVQVGLGVIEDTGYTGEGVYIGITDWGFDYTHPNYNSNGRSNIRLEMAWDHFRNAGPAPEGFNYGTLIQGHMNLKNAKCDTSNIYGYGTHGTHVAGICAGRGINGDYMGQAPEAKLLFCTFGLGEKQWMDAVGWMKQVAQDSAKRLVINSSWGMYSFSTLDGTSLLSRAINNWSDEGIVFCTSGGNNYGDQFHISRTFTAETADTLKTVAEWFSSPEATGQVLILWGEEGHDFDVAFGIEKDSVLFSIPFISTSLGDTIITDTLLFNETPVGYYAIVEHANPFDNRPHVQLEVSLLKKHDLHLYVTANSGTVHAWNVANKKNHAGNEGCSFVTRGLRGFTPGDDLYGVGEPACAAKCISVAAHNADRKRTDNGAYIPGDHAPFSSSGPLIDGSMKPEISAPGVNVVSSISYWTTDPHEEYFSFWILDKKYIWSAMSGTSMSCPAVTGIVALMLQANPAITVDRIREAIFTTARNDEKTGPLVERDSMDLRWGWGKIDARRAVNRAVEMVSVQQVEDLRTPLRLFPNPAASQVTVNTGCGEPQTLQVYSVDGRLLHEATVRTQATLDINQWRRGVYIVRVGSRTEKLIVN